jgi:shikimate dehydrogenase
MKHFAIIGKPISHSLAGEWFNNHFLQNKIDADFKMIEPSANDLQNFKEWIFNNNFNGLLVTSPYKKEVIPLLDEVDRQALSIGAVNIINVEKTKTIGFNTDYIAFENSLLNIRPEGLKNAVLIGNGGAASAVLAALNRMNIATTIVSRNKGPNNILFSELTKELLGNTDLIINATPLGMLPCENECPPVNYSFINKNAVAYDLIYNPPTTLFLKKCKETGCEIYNGKEMVEIVYKESLKIWEV